MDKASPGAAVNQVFRWGCRSQTCRKRKPEGSCQEEKKKGQQHFLSTYYVLVMTKLSSCTKDPIEGDFETFPGGNSERSSCLFRDPLPVSPEYRWWPGSPFAGTFGCLVLVNGPGLVHGFHKVCELPTAWGQVWGELSGGPSGGSRQELKGLGLARGPLSLSACQ